MRKWVKAENVPPEWENHWAWCYKDWDKSVERTIVPASFSREPRHCRGVWFMLNDPPAPPST